MRDETSKRTGRNTDRTIVLNSRITPEVEKKFYEIWDSIQATIKYPVRLKKQDVFSIIIEDYHAKTIGENK
jgi:hypothetical protein